MQPRLDINKYLKSGPFRAVQALQKEVEASGLEHSLVELVKIRGSQINGCAYCIDMHTKDARALGETEQRIYALNAWRETPFFSERERAALAFTEALTLIAENHVPEDVYEDVRLQFEEPQVVALALAIANINVWNRLVITARPVVGSYQSPYALTA